MAKHTTGEDKLEIQIARPETMADMDEEQYELHLKLHRYDAEEVTTEEDRKNGVERWELSEDFYITAIRKLQRLQRDVNQRLENTLDDVLRGAVPGSRIVQEIPHILGSEVEALQGIHELWVLALRQRADAREGPWVILNSEDEICNAGQYVEFYSLYGSARSKADEMNEAYSALQEASGGKSCGRDEFSVVRQAEYKEGQLVWVARKGDGDDKQEYVVIEDKPGSKVKVREEGETDRGGEHMTENIDRDELSKRRKPRQPKEAAEPEPEPEAAEDIDCNDENGQLARSNDLGQ